MERPRAQFATTPTEEEFEIELEIFRTEVEQAKQFFYASLAIDAEAGDSEVVHRMLNETPMLWKTIVYALQKSTFVALGRIFDSDPRSHGIGRLVKLATSEPAMFSRGALAVRKPDAPQAYIDVAHEPTVDEWRQLRKEIERRRSVYLQVYDPLRDRFYAHLERGVNAAGLFQKTTITELEQVLAFLGSVYEALWQTYANGGPLLLRHEPHSVNAMRTAAAIGKVGWTVQERIVAEAHRFLTVAASGHGPSKTGV